MSKNHLNLNYLFNKYNINSHLLTQTQKQQLLTLQKLANALFSKSVKKYKKLFVNNIHYSVFYNAIAKKYKYINTLYFAITPRQVYLAFKLIYPGKYSHWGGEHFYVMGFDNGKLFINKIHNIDELRDYEYIAYERINDVIVKVFRSQKDFYSNLGYDYDINDINNPEEINIIGGGRYRVQGDLVIDVDTYRDYYKSIAYYLSLALNDLASSILTHRIANIISNLGFSVDVSNRIIVIDGLPKKAPANTTNISEFQYALAYYIMHCIYDKLIVEDVITKLTNVSLEIEKQIKNDGLFIEIIYMLKHNEYPIIIVEAKPSRGRFGSPYDTVTIRVKADISDRYILEKYRNSIYYHIIKDIKPQIISFSRGNHYVMIKNALPHTLNIILSNAFNGSNVTLTISTHEDIFVTPNTEIQLRHPEHGELKINMHINAAIRFRHTDVTNDFRDRLNYYMFKQISDKAIKLFEDVNKE